MLGTTVMEEEPPQPPDPRHSPDPVPDHSQGVDYKAVYTERYFDGVDSHFSPCGHRDEASYYER
jgi:hypothetical protein